MSLDDEIAHLRDLDLQGLRARWQSMSGNSHLPICPVICCLPILAYRMQADALGDLDPDTVDR